MLTRERIDRQLRQARARAAREAAGKAAGEAVHEARKVRANIGTHPPEDVKRLREAANETAACCADCFEPLTPGQSVTLVTRAVEHIPAHPHPLGTKVPAHYRQRLVPICLCCWLVDIAVPKPETWPRTDANKPIDDRHEVRRCRCEGCARPLRIIAHRWKWRRSRLRRLRDRCCCQTCFRRANERRRVRHDQIACEACGEMFTPRQSTARTCSNTCRQRLFRQRHR